MTRDDDVMMCKHVILTTVEVLDCARNNLIDARKRLSDLCKTTNEQKAEAMLYQLDKLIEDLQKVLQSME